MTPLLNRTKVFTGFGGSRRERTLSSHVLFLLQGVSLISLLGMLASGVVQAQTSDAAIDKASSSESTPSDTAPEPVPSAAEAPISSPVAPTEAPASSVESAEVYIDPTSYDLGATQRTNNTTNPTSPVTPGSLRTSPEFSSIPGQGNYDAGQTTPVGRDYYNVRDFYNRTLRPPGLLGNGNIRLIFPLTIPAPITSLFGWRVHPITGDARFHSGTDLGAPMGTPVIAAFAGRVAIADFMGGYGLAVTLQHNNGTQETLYGHLSEIFVKPGEWVEQGKVIGRVGSTGLSTGPHLHFEFRQLTPEGWVAMDAGNQLEFALAQLVNGMQVPQTMASAQPDAWAGVSLKFQQLTASAVPASLPPQFRLGSPTPPATVAIPSEN